MVTLADALEYYRRGWAVLPMKPGTKRPDLRSWDCFQHERPVEAMVAQWFRSGRDRNIGVVLGVVSGELVCRDFDDVDAYVRWAAEFPTLAKALPTVETGRPGRHVYCVADLTQIRQSSASGGTILPFADGELRGGGLCVLPPSVHPTGRPYRWTVPLPAKLPRLDLRDAGFLPADSPALFSGDATERAESNREDGAEQRGQKRTEKTEDMKGKRREVQREPTPTVPMASAVWTADPDVEQAILDSLPAGPGKRNRQVFELARALKAIPALTDAPALELEPFVRRWHDLARPVITTKPFEETWIDFLQAWKRVKFPKGTEPMARIVEAARKRKPPDVAMKFEQEPLRLLVAVCRELQLEAGDGPFYLGARTAGRILGVDHTTAWRWLFLLRETGILHLTTKGDAASGKASRYRYLAG